MAEQQHEEQNGTGDNNNFVLQPSFGARLGYRELAAAGLVADPPIENHMPNNHSAEIYPAYTGPMDHLTVITADPMQRITPQLWLLRDVPNPEQAYALIPKPEIKLNHHHPQWGSIYFALICPRVGHNVFEAPRKKDAKYVAIKRLYKPVVQWYLQMGGEENPYKEVARMQELGDNVHVLSCVEFLEDNDYLYIIMPKACDEGTLKDVIEWFDADEIMESQRCHQIFRKILKILLYLEEKNINHHDLSPDNFLFLTPDNLVVFDLALSVRIPTNPANGQRTLLKPQGNFGTHAWMCPEVFFNRHPYDGVAMDLWAAAILLYNLLTNQILYARPDLTDIGFAYFVHAQGLSSIPLNERALEILHNLNNPEQFQQLVDKATSHLNLSPEAVELLENLLRVDPLERYTLAQAIESPFVQQGVNQPLMDNNGNNGAA